MSGGLVSVSYIGATILFILTLGGLSNQKTARRGNIYGIVGMSIAILATVLGLEVSSNVWLVIITMGLGGVVGLTLAKKIEMTQMPELVAILHSLVGLAAVIVGYVNFLGDSSLVGVEKTIHEAEIYVGVLIGAVTFSGSIIAFGKLSGKISGNPMLIPGHHWYNLALLLVTIWIGTQFIHAAETGEGAFALFVMTIFAIAFGVNMVMAIGGADMPVIVSMLNSYSGWAASATGFMLSNDLLIVVGALVGSSGAILSYIMCRAMNRKFISVIAGGFGTETSSTSSGAEVDRGDVDPIETDEFSNLLLNAKKVMIIPGYGMAVAQAQHTMFEITKVLRKKKINVRFGIHPVAGRMPGHMNVLLAEAKVPYDIVCGMDEINDDFSEIDVSVIIGANDIVNPSALDDPNSPIAGMPVLECWKSKTSVVLKRSMATGYAGVQNPLFFKDNTRMYFGDAKKSLDAVLQAIST